MSPSTEGDRSRRVYRACDNCRLRKVRCRVENPEAPAFPCARCRRMNLNCASTDSGHVRLQRSAPSLKRRIEDLPIPRGDTPRQRPRITSGEEFHTDDSETPQRFDESYTPEASSAYGEPCIIVKAAIHNPSDAFNALIRVYDKPKTVDLEKDVRSVEGTVQQATPSPSSLTTRSTQIQLDSPNSTTSRTGLYSNEDPMKAWNDFWLVKQKWLNAEEAAWYIQTFFTTLGPMTSILLQFFADPKNHGVLIAYEPILCYSLMTISTSMFACPFSQPCSNTHFLHAKCWSITQRLIERILWADESGTKSKLRTQGTVLALMLLSEWPPEALQMSTDSLMDAVIVDVDQQREKLYLTLEDEERHIKISNGSELMTDLSEPLIRWDRFSAMMLGLAESLAKELNIYELHQRAPQKNRDGVESSSIDRVSITAKYMNRRARIRLLFDIHGSLLSHRMSSITGISRDLLDADYKTLEELSQQSEGLESAQLLALCKLENLSRISRSAKDVLLHRDNFARTNMHATDHVVWLQHFSTELQNWHDDFTQAQLPHSLCDILEIEYEALWLQFMSVSIHRVSARLVELLHSAARNSIIVDQDALTAYRMISQDSKYTEETKIVKNAIPRARNLLATCVNLEQPYHLRYLPVRTFMRIIFAATLLLKASCCYPDFEELELSIAVVQRVHDALLDNTKGRVDILPKIASIISLHLTQFFKVRSRHHGPSSIHIAHNSPRSGSRPVSPLVSPVSGVPSIQHINRETDHNADMFQNTAPSAEDPVLTGLNLDTSLFELLPEDWSHPNFEPWWFGTSSANGSTLPEI